MFDLLLTIAVIFLGYKGYQWYTNLQSQVKPGPEAPPEVDADADFHDPAHPQPGDENDYIDYEEVK